MSSVIILRLHIEIITCIYYFSHLTTFQVENTDFLFWSLTEHLSHKGWHFWKSKHLIPSVKSEMLFFVPVCRLQTKVGDPLGCRSFGQIQANHLLKSPHISSFPLYDQCIVLHNLYCSGFNHSVGFQQINQIFLTCMYLFSVMCKN